MTVTATETMITAGAASKKKIARPRRRLSPGRFLAWALLIAVLVLTLFPFYWMLRTSFSSDKALFTNPTSILPADFTIGPYLRVLGLATPAEAIAEGGSGANVNFLLYLRNSVIYATAVTLGQLLFCSFAAYAFARLRWPGRNAVFFVFLTALMIPGIFTILPNFLLIRDIGLLNTIIGMILPTLLMAPFSIFFLRQFFLGINKEIEEAAKIDGAGHLRIFFRIIVPMSTAPIVTLGILTYISTWNDYFWPLLVGGTEDSRVLTVALGVFKSQTPGGAPDWAGLMAATVIAALPVLILFFLFGRRVVDSIGFSGLK
ncbi:carbohydrate ABC transporter permease [Microbacterium rhizosphaerae]|uniref:Carbohydrate ABC transporter permease n=1 Tax=Microbacterium rhizosphaerae TaxID=1678237 RepID=A0ABZ0SUN7_9MICO|nr:carbohydrate ABC transporter permease [Microbacterium rhizosphaerae]WPR90952.1 carbohydrate ABC transporter permease [Microbacterium rhizosphaerae]